MTAKTLILGLGNPLRSDDGVGWVVSGRFQGFRNVEVVTTHQILPEHAELASRFEQVIMVDASVETEPGEISMKDLSQPLSRPKAMGHELDPADFSELIRLYTQQPPEMTVVSIGGYDFSAGDQLSDTVSQKIDHLVLTIKQILAKNVQKGV